MGKYYYVQLALLVTVHVQLQCGALDVAQGTTYESGIYYTRDGVCSRKEILHSGKNTLSLNSQCLLLWSNLGALCVGMLTQSQSHQKIIGKIFACETPTELENYCVTHLRCLWKHMRKNMQLTDEELSYLIKILAETMLKVNMSRNISLRNINCNYVHVYVCIS